MHREVQGGKARRVHGQGRRGQARWLDGRGGRAGATLGAEVGGVIPGPRPHPSAKFSSGSVSHPDFCSQILKSDVKPGFPKTIKTNDPDVLRAARHSAESFNNCSNDAFLFRESRVSRALVQVRSGLATVQGSQV